MTSARRKCSTALQSTRVTQDKDDLMTEDSDEMRWEGTFRKRPRDKGAVPAVRLSQFLMITQAYLRYATGKLPLTGRGLRFHKQNVFALLKEVIMTVKS